VIGVRRDAFRRRPTPVTEHLVTPATIQKLAEVSLMFLQCTNLQFKTD
jgi:hypothetical protein